MQVMSDKLNLSALKSLYVSIIFHKLHFIKTQVKACVVMLFTQCMASYC